MCIGDELMYIGANLRQCKAKMDLLHREAQRRQMRTRLSRYQRSRKRNRSRYKSEQTLQLNQSSYNLLMQDR